MSEHRAHVRWSRDERPFDYEHYSRDHHWMFDGGQHVLASAAPAYFGNAQAVDPEEALVAALSSCHMLTLLAIAAKKGWVIDHYDDEPIGVLEKNEDGRLAITRVTLRPHIVFGADHAPDAAALARLHAQAHAHCFIANSVKTHIDVQAR